MHDPDELSDLPPVSDPTVEVAHEAVGRGLALALVPVLLMPAVTAYTMRLQLAASVSALAMGLVAVLAYRLAARHRAQRGLPWLIALVGVGVVLCYYGAYLGQLSLEYDAAGLKREGVSLWQIWKAYPFSSEFLKSQPTLPIRYLVMGWLGTVMALRLGLGHSTASLASPSLP